MLSNMLAPQREWGMLLECSVLADIPDPESNFPDTSQTNQKPYLGLNFEDTWSASC